MTTRDSRRGIGRRRLWSQLISRRRFDDPAETIAHLGAVQAQEYLSALWAIGLRTRSATLASIEQAITNRKLVRTWPMRGTIHWVHPSDVRWMLELLTPRVIRIAASRFRQLELDESLFARSADLFVGALQGGKQLSRAEMYKVLEQAGISIAGQRGYHFLWRAAQDGLLDEWAPPGKLRSRDEALAELARRYFNGHGPATLKDFVWWSGLTVADARAGVATVRTQLAEERIDGEIYWSSPEPLPPESSLGSAYLLPNFDEYLVGYRNRSAVLDPLHAKQAAPGGGMLSATIVVDGTVIGVWRRAIKGAKVELRITPFAKLRTSEAAAITAAEDSYGRFLGLSVDR